MHVDIDIHLTLFEKLTILKYILNYSPFHTESHNVRTFVTWLQSFICRLTDRNLCGTERLTHKQRDVQWQG